MPAVVELAEVQAWLESTKYTLSKVDEDLEQTARQLVYGRLTTAHFNSSTWTTVEATPELVRRIIAMLVAAWEYDRATAEDQLEGSSYADKLERRALALLQSIIDGDLTSDDLVIDEELVATSNDSIVFFPTDAESLQRAPGSLVAYGDEDHSRKFSVGMTF